MPPNPRAVVEQVAAEGQASHHDISELHVTNKRLHASSPVKSERETHRSPRISHRLSCQVVVLRLGDARSA